MAEIQLDRRSTHERWRLLKDRGISFGMGVGGVSVIAAIALIFFYLLYVVLPLFLPADIEQTASFDVPGGGRDHTL